MYMQLEYESKGGISWLLFFKFQNSFFPWLRNFKRITFSLQFKKLRRLSYNNLFINSLLPHPRKKEGGEKKERERETCLSCGVPQLTISVVAITGVKQCQLPSVIIQSDTDIFKKEKATH